jgi:Ca2+-binding RTX toxin-like protein
MATPLGDAVALTGDLRIDYLVQGSAWQLAPDRVLTYSLDLNFDGPTQGWNDAWSSLIAQGFAAWEAVANVHFLQVGAANAQTQNQSSADIAIALLPDGEAAFAGFGLFPDPAFADQVLDEAGYSREGGFFPYPRPEGDITFNPVITGAVAEWEAYEIVLHEIGHALGLKHVDDDGGNGRPVGTLPVDAFPSLMWSSLDGVIRSTPTVYDIQAIQHIYGPNQTYHTGNDTYSLAGSSYVAIWDAGGDDRLVRGNSQQGADIDLRPGRGSGNGNQDFKNVWIAYGVTIEDATGGVAGDSILGNSVANELRGGGGGDLLSGAAGADSLVGGTGNDLLDGSADSDALRGDAGVDTLRGGTGADVLDGGDDRDELYGEEGFDNLAGGAGTDHLWGGDGADTLLGGEGFDTLWGEAGNDSLAGGGRDDKYIVTNSADIVVENPGEGQDTVEASVSYTLSDNVEVLTLVGTDPLSGTGSDDANLIVGNRNENHLLGEAGADTLRGDAGNDTLEGGTGADLLDAGYSGKDHLEGGAGEDSLYGGLGADYLDGGSGDDSMSGGDGNDVFVVDSTGDQVLDGSYTSGSDTVQSLITFVLPAAYTGSRIENLVLIGHQSNDGSGNEMDNTIQGNDATNHLRGEGGDDSLLGMNGDDLLEGGNGHDVLKGLAGNDTLSGGEGFNRMAGGTGDDVYRIDSELPAYSIVLWGDARPGGNVGNVYGEAYFNFVQLVDFTGDGEGDYLAIGNLSSAMRFDTQAIGENLAIGLYTDVRGALPPEGSSDHAGMDLFGGTPASGGWFEISVLDIDYSGEAPTLLAFSVKFEHVGFAASGSKSTFGVINYNHTATADEVLEAGGQGHDTVESSVNFALPDNVEDLVLVGSEAVDGTGNAQANTLTGNDAANVLDGAAGRDTLTGGAGADTFAFSSALDAETNIDRVTDFTVGEDALLLDSAIFGALSAGALADGQFVASANPVAADGDDHILYDTTTGALLYDADGNDVGLAVRFATLANAPAITASQFTVG